MLNKINMTNFLKQKQKQKKKQKKKKPTKNLLKNS